MQADGLRAAMDLPFDADSFGVLLESGLNSIEELMAKAGQRYAERCLGTDMAPFLRYHQNLNCSPAEITILELYSPAWRLKDINLNRNVQVPPLNLELIELYTDMN